MAEKGVFEEIIDGDVYKYYMDGEWRKSASGKSVSVINPTTRWKRAELLHKAAAILKEHKAPIAECLVKEVAKPAKDAVTEVVRSGYLTPRRRDFGYMGRESFWNLIAFLATNGASTASVPRYPRVPMPQSSLVLSILGNPLIPLGVNLAIPPFNHPINLAVSKFAPALIAGNSLVLKPPTQFCSTRDRLLPLGWFPKRPDRLCHRQRLGNSFTGGDTGIAISKKAGMIPLQMELGGKDACVVLEDADLDLAAANIVKGVEKVKAKMAKPTVGPPEEDCNITPVVSESSANFIEGALLIVMTDSNVAQECVFTRDIIKAIMISDAMKTGTVQINSAPAWGPDHFPFQGITNHINMMTKIKSIVINLPSPSYTMG
ncbi:NADP-dependent glyceraldehyde-3-phosphate dehydrogenase [Cocos nucifera]|uniref:NADP-dependent glyceraldehyde-3-phosphate dehydrogenase n=1 Tax=Cocos nucifera TaxID=13894 RepID=A0A8K0HU49_COCNU|nr:NADP-dependent glyceraldehyde-3-phosphate dehydrogenase [Cocos nucifera]